MDWVKEINTNNEFKVFLNEILDALSYCSLEDATESNWRETILEPFKENYFKPFDTAVGATKAVLIFKEKGFVLKVPFCGDEEDFFCGAQETDEGWNYCDTEIARREYASTYGVEDFFAKVTFLENINCHPVYIQDICISMDDHSSTNTWEEKDEMEAEMYDKGYDCFNSDWLIDAFKYYGEALCYKFMKFIEDFDIDDLHARNVGYCGNQPIIIDYASFNS